MAKTLTHTQTFKYDQPKKGSSLFRAKEKDIASETAIQTSGYIMRNAMKKVFGIKDLDELKQIEVTYKVTVSANGKKDEELANRFSV